MHKNVKTYLDKLPSPQKDICKKVRKLLLASIPEIEEEFKNGVPWYGKFYIVGLKDSVNIGFSVTGLSKQESANFKGTGKYMRHIKIHRLDEIDNDSLVKLFRLVWDKATCYEG